MENGVQQLIRLVYDAVLYILLRIYAENGHRVGSQANPGLVRAGIDYERVRVLLLEEGHSCVWGGKLKCLG